MDINYVKPGETVGAEINQNKALQDNSIVEQPPTAPAAPSAAAVDDVEKRRQEVAAAMGWEAPEQKPAEAAPAAPAAPAEPAQPAAPAAPEAPAQPPAPQPEPVPAAKPAKPVEEIIAETAKAVGDQMRSAMSPTPEVEPASESLSPEDTEAYGIIRKMEELGTAPAGTAERFKAFAFSRYAYQDRWEKANPDKEFNSDDSEHEEFYKGQPEIDDSAYEAAKLAMMVDRQVSERVAREMQPMREKAALEEAKPAIMSALQKSLIGVIESAAPDLIKVAVVNGNLDLSPENIQRIMDADSIAAGVLEPLLMGEVRPIIVEIEKTAVPGLNYCLNPSNPVHAAIQRYASEVEKEMAKKNEVRSGKRFLTFADWNAKVSAIEKRGNNVEANINALSDHYYCVSPDDIEAHVVKVISERAKQQISHLDKLAQKKYRGSAPAPAPKPDAQPPVPQPQPAPQLGAIQRPPSVGSQTETVDATAGQPDVQKKWGETAVQTHFK